MLVNEILTNVAPPVGATVGAGMVPCQCARSGGEMGEDLMIDKLRILLEI